MKDANRVKLMQKLARHFKVPHPHFCNIPKRIIIDFDVRPTKYGFVRGWEVTIDERRKTMDLSDPHNTN